MVCSTDEQTSSADSHSHSETDGSPVLPHGSPRVKAGSFPKAVRGGPSYHNQPLQSALSTEQGLQALVKQPSGTPEARRYRDGGYIKRLPKDPWGNDYQYLSPGEKGAIDIYSLGADGQENGEGIASDIGNWNVQEFQ